MYYEDFKNQIGEEVKEAMYERGFEDVEVTYSHVNKPDAGYDAMVVKPAGSSIGVTINLEATHERVASGESVKETASRLADTICTAIENQPAVDIESLTNYEEMKSKLAVEVIGKEANAELLETIPHKDIEDLAIVYRFIIDSSSDGRASILATKAMIETMGVTQEQLHEDAIANSPKLNPVVISGMSEVMMEMIGPEQAELMGLVVPPEQEPMYVATNSSKINGAGVMAYEDFMEQAADRIGGQSFYLLPSSKHEVLIVPDDGNMKLQDLQAMVQQVNSTEVQPQDRLSDSVYHYDKDAKIFELGEKFEARQSEIEAVKLEKESVLGDLKAKKEEVAKQAPKKDAIEKTTKSKGGEAL